VTIVAKPAPDDPRGLGSHDTGSHEAGSGRPVRAGQVLADLPLPLWGELVRASRRAFDRLERGEVPVKLRPFVGWKPEMLTREHPRTAIAEALAGDGRFREVVGEAIEPAAALEAGRDHDSRWLVATYGEEVAATALAALGRWQDLESLAARVGERLAARQRAAAEEAERRQVEEAAGSAQRLQGELTAARRERDEQRSRAEAAEQRLSTLEEQRDEATARARDADEEQARLRRELEDVRRQAHQRQSRLQRRRQEAEQAAKVDRDRAGRVADELEEKAEELRAALSPEESRGGAGVDQAAGGEAGTGGSDAVSPRGLTDRGLTEPPVAEPGRPCGLPPGVGSDTPAAVEALLRIPGLAVFVDGYNVTKDVRGRPGEKLADQRGWLVALAGALVARYRSKVTVVFDGTDQQLARPPAQKGVVVEFSEGDEIADERIAELVEASPETPALVVSSDREVAAAGRAQGANTASSGTFLRTVDA
jgi:predicted RNA-binding protein with PIN domain